MERKTMFSNIRFPEIFKKSNVRFAFISTFLTGIIVHLYKFVNYLPNNDSLYNLYAKQDIIQSGRWFLAIPAAISSNFDLPWLTGLLSVIYISVAAVFIVLLFDIKNRFIVFLFGAILVAYPSITSIFYYGFTSDAYVLALLLTAAAVYISRFGEKKPSRLIISALLLCLSCAIYQAFYSFAIVLTIVYYVYTVLTSEVTTKKAWQYIAKQALIFVGSLIVYYVIWIVIKKITGADRNDYLGVSSVGFDFDSLITGFKDSFNELLNFITESNLSKANLTFYVIGNIVLILSFAVSVIISIVKSKIYKSPVKLLTVIGALIASYPCIVIFSVISDKVSVSSRMLMSTSMFILLSILLIERYFNIHLKNLFGIFMVMIVFNYSIMANFGYFTLHRISMISMNKASELMAEIHKYENGYDLQKIVFIGEGSDKKYPIINPDNVMEKEKSDFYGYYRLLAQGGDLLFDNTHAYFYLVNYCGLDLQHVDTEEMLRLSNEDVVRNLKEWPSDEAFAVIDDTLVVRLSYNEDYWYNYSSD
ncbi:MAG: glucosyltransferase domain-containing protein [Clostridia bacterium]|nr:glucosyltransferase domain-containing protein [Clostridia bacterium]